MKIKVTVGQEVDVDPYKVIEQFIEDTNVQAECKLEGIKDNVAKLLISIHKIAKRNGVLLTYGIGDA